MSDLISRSKLIESFEPDHKQDWYTPWIIDKINEQPTVEAKPVVHGEWEECDWVEYDGHGACIRYPKGALRCSECHNAFKKDLLWKNNFCPNCGADMRKKVQDE